MERAKHVKAGRIITRLGRPPHTREKPRTFSYKHRGGRFDTGELSAAQKSSEKLVIRLLKTRHYVSEYAAFCGYPTSDENISGNVLVTIL